MSSPAPRRRAEKPSRRREREEPEKAPRARRVPRSQRRPERLDRPMRPRRGTGDLSPGARRALSALWVLVVAGGLAAIGLSAAGWGPGASLSRGGSTAVVTAYVWALAARTGGRPVVFAALTAVSGVAVVVLDRDHLTTGAAVMTCVVSAVLAVMVTVPAVTYLRAAREAVVSVLVASIGAVATVGFEPVISLARFEYVTLGLSLVGALLLVYRLGAGLHGLGRRGILTVVVGSVVLALTLAYAELLRRYGTPGLVEWLFDGIRWTRSTLGAFPRPIEALLGIPAIAWGCHMRARRRQGWWVCAFGVAATAPIANALLNTTITRTEAVLVVVYALAVGLVVGFVLIRADLRLTAPRGRRGRRDEEATAVRPEPPRTSALL